jgi:hypothetical protein
MTTSAGPTSTARRLVREREVRIVDDGPTARIVSFLASRELIVFLVAVGVGLRIVQYASNRSLWFDEALAALNLMDRSFGGLTRTLNFNQGAPLGFLFIERAAGAVFGFSELAVRFYPLAAGVLALIAFAFLARRILLPPAAALAVFFFAVSDQLVYYSTELKPYSVDVAATVIILLLGLVMDTRLLTRRRAVGIGAAGVFCLINSNPALFVASSVLVVAVADVLVRRRRWDLLRARLWILVPWTIAIAGVVAFAELRLTHVRVSFGGGSGPFLGASQPADGSWPGLRWLAPLGTDLASAIGFSQSRPYTEIEKVAAAVALLGLVSLLRRNRRLAAILALPFAFVLLASAVNQYPITVRTILFLVPLLVLLLGEGFAWLYTSFNRTSAKLVVVALALVVAASPTATAFRHLLHPTKREEIKPALAYLQTHWRNGDALYVHPGSQYALAYYVRCRCFGDIRRNDPPFSAVQPVSGGLTQSSPALVSSSRTVVIGRYHDSRWDAYVEDIRRLRPRGRVWVLTTHANDEAEERFLARELPRRLTRFGPEVAREDAPNAQLTLFDFR